jgi:hypothetical protein
MSHSKLSAAVVALAIGLTQTGGEIVHVQESPADRFVACVARTLGTRVFADGELGRAVSKLEGCDVSRDGLAAWLKAHEVILASTPAGKPAYLYPASYLSFGPVGQRVTWRTLSIEPKFETYTVLEGAAPVAADRVASFGAHFLEAARPAPVDAPGKAVAGTEMASVSYRVALMQRRMRPDGPEAVLALLGVQDGPVRLAYGEIVDGALHVRWDSPVFSSRLLQMGFQDVTGDGEDEIVAAYAEGANATSLALFIFDRTGRELTRQEDCYFVFDWEPAGHVCPIRLIDFELEPTTPSDPSAAAPSTKPQPKDIVARDKENTSKRTIYRLDSEGRYRRLP